MNIVFWDIENIKYLKNNENFKGIDIDTIECVYAKPFADIEKRIKIKYKKLNIHALLSRGPDLADFHILALLREHIINSKGQPHVYLLTHDRLLSYRFIVLARSLGLPKLNIHTDLEDEIIRGRSKLGASLFEAGDKDKIPQTDTNTH